MHIKWLAEELDVNNIMAYISGTSALTAPDLQDKHLVTIMTALGIEKPRVYTFASPTKDLYHSECPFRVDGVSTFDGRVILHVRGQYTKRIERKWTLRSQNVVAGNNEVVLRWEDKE